MAVNSPMHAALWLELGGLALLGLSFSSCSKPVSPPPGGSSIEPLSVEVVRVAPRPMERTLTATGWLAAREETTSSVKVPGRLEAMPADLGSAVQAGDLLARVEPRDYEIRLEQAQAALSQARALLGLPLEGDTDQVDLSEIPTVRQARAVLEEATRAVQRIRNLSQEGISAAADLDTAEARFAVAREQHETALLEGRTRMAALAQRRAEFELAAKQLADTAVRAPFAGIVQARLANLGEYLSVGAPVLALVQADPLRLRLEVAERDAMQIQPGLKVRMSVEGSTNAHEGRIARLSPALNEANRMRTVEADIPNPGGLLPGLFVRAEVVLREDDPALAVPAGCLVVFAGLEKVITIAEDTALEKPVTTGRRAGGWIEIVAGLSEGERVALEPRGLQTGQKVQAVETPPIRYAETR